MQSKSIALEKISDIYAFRIVTNSKDDCYKVLGKIHGNGQWCLKD